MQEIFQLLLERAAKRQSLHDAVAEVSRYAMKNSKLIPLWMRFIEHPDISEEVLGVLAQDINWMIRRAIAERKQDLPEDVLKSLAQDTDWRIRRAVTERKQDLPEDVLKTLAQDVDWMVRREVERRKTESQLNSSPSTRIT